MRIRSYCLAALLVCTAAPCLAATPAKPPFEIKSIEGFAVKPEDLAPTGCTYTTSYSRDGTVMRVKCETPEQFRAGFVPSERLKVKPPAKTADGKYIVEITE